MAELEEPALSLQRRGRARQALLLPDGHLADPPRSPMTGRPPSWCRSSERGWVQTCFQSLGRDASGFTVQNAPKIVRDLPAGGPGREGCIYGAARDFRKTTRAARRRAVLRDLGGEVPAALLRGDRDDPRRHAPLRPGAGQRRATGQRRLATGTTATAAPRSRSARWAGGSRVALEPAPQAGALPGDVPAGAPRRGSSTSASVTPASAPSPASRRATTSSRRSTPARADHRGQRRAAAEFRSRVPAGEGP